MARGEAQIGIFQPEVSADGAMPRRTIPTMQPASVGSGLESIAQGLGNLGDAWKRKQASDSAVAAMSQLADANVSLLKKSEDLKQQFPEGSGFTDAMNAEVKKTSDELLKNAKSDPILLRHLQQGLINLGENYQTHAIQWEAHTTAEYKIAAVSENVDKNSAAVEAGVMPYDQAIATTLHQINATPADAETKLKLSKGVEQQYSLADSRRLATNAPQVFVDNKDDPSKLPQSFQNLNDAQRQSIMTMARTSLAQMQGNAIAGAYSQGGERAGNQAFGTIAKMPYDDELKQMIQQQANQGITAWRQGQAAKLDQPLLALDTRLATGKPLPNDLHNILAMHEAGVWDAAQTASKIGVLNRALESKADDDAAHLSVQEYFDKGMGMDPKSANTAWVKKGVNAVFDNIVAKGNLPPLSIEWQNQAANMFHVLNVPADSAMAAARTAWASGKPEERVQAAQFIDRMSAISADKGVPMDIDKVTKAEMGVAVDALRANMPESAVAQVTDKIHNMSESERKRLNQQYAAASNNIDTRAMTALNHAVPGDQNFNMPSTLRDNYLTLVHDYYLATGGNQKVAVDNAIRDIKADHGWGVTTINGDPQWMRYAPEMQGHDPTQVREDMERTVAGLTEDPKSVKLTPIPETVLTQGAVWGLTVTSKDGVTDTIMGKDGKVKAYNLPNQQAEQAEIRRRISQKEQNRMHEHIRSNLEIEKMIKGDEATNSVLHGVL